MAFADIYRAGGAIGFPPREMDRMSLWQAAQVISGWNEAQGAKPPAPAPSRDDYDRLMEQHS